MMKQPTDVPIKKILLKISQNSQEKTCVEVSFLIKWQASGCLLNWTVGSYGGYWFKKNQFEVSKRIILQNNFRGTFFFINIS